MSKDQNIELQKAKGQEYETLLQNQSDWTVQIMPYRSSVSVIRLQPGQSLVFRSEFCSLLAPFESIKWSEKRKEVIVNPKRRSNYPLSLEVVELGYPCVWITYHQGTDSMTISFVRISGDRIKSNLNRGIPSQVSLPLNHSWISFIEIEDRAVKEDFLSPTGSGEILSKLKQKFVGVKERKKEEVKKIQQMASEEKKRVEQKKLSRYLQSIES